MLNDLLMLQSLLLITVFFFINTINILTIWYLSGIYLILIGLMLMLDDGDIFIGFLWVIDLGVGLIFFIFILHFSNFLYQKSSFDFINKFFYLFIFFVFFFVFFYIISNPINANYNNLLQKSWFFFVSWYNYYDLFNLKIITELNVLREIYFYNNSVHFFIINFVVFYGIISSIIFTFSIKKFFSYATVTQLTNVGILNHVNTYLFIRNQNFIKQQFTSTGARVWIKKKSNTLNDL